MQIRERDFDLVELISEERKAVEPAGVLVSMVMVGCASHSGPVPQRFQNELIKEEYMRGTVILPNGEETFYVAKAARVPVPTGCYIPGGYV